MSTARRITDLALSGSVAAWLGDPEAGERMVMVTSGEHVPLVRPAAAAAARNTKLLAVVGGLALLAIVVAGFALLKGGGGEGSDTRLAKATVRINAPDYSGSGVIIDAKKGLIITNAHVGDSSAPGLAVQYPDEFLDFPKSPTEFVISVSPGLDRAAEDQYRAQVVAVDGYLDMAVLKITKTAAGALISPGDLDGLTAMKIGNSDKVKTGDSIRIVGYPGVNNSRNTSITTGVIASDVQDDRLSTNPRGSTRPRRRRPATPGVRS